MSFRVVENEFVGLNVGVSSFEVQQQRVNYASNRLFKQKIYDIVF